MASRRLDGDSGLSVVGPERCRSFHTPCRVRPVLPQLGAQLPGPGLAHRVLLENLASTFPHFFPAAAPSTPAGELRRGKNAASSPPIVEASACEEPGLVEDLPGPQQVIDRPPQLGRQNAERLGGAVLLRLACLPTFGPLACAAVQVRRFAAGPAQMRVADLFVAETRGFARRLL